ncbi:hypothetical protein CYY_003872 [Polysphondylium violaceum]|uniref:Mitochondrial substrate carrier family protein n=1 Tax=Polysphondylium violaceum TaxID=133409 RepID=A0A8J4PU31_9MYCE|nr:hypothetical protein CYY_003872 [Polysphondylium violaceum]
MSNKEVAKDSALIVALKDIVAGSIGGIGQVISGHPLDTIKVRLQTQSVTNPVYSGAMDCLRKTVAQEGALGLYKGVASPLVGLSIMNSVMFLSYGQAKNLILGSDKNRELSVAELTLAGCMAGLSIAFVDSPVDLFKSQMQVQTDKSTYNGIMDCASKIWKQRGIPGVFQGLGATLLRDIPANGAYFGAYEITRRYFAGTGRVEDISSTKILIAGAVGGVSYWTLTYPADVVKSSIQTDSINPATRKYNGIVDCFRKIYREQGINGLYRGFAPCFVRSIPANAVCFLLYEKARELM